MMLDTRLIVVMLLLLIGCTPTAAPLPTGPIWIETSCEMDTMATRAADYHERGYSVGPPMTTDYRWVPQAAPTRCGFSATRP